MTKRIVSGIFILTALGALGVILAGALTSGEQLIVRFLTAVIVAALGLYVISDLRLQADDDAAGIRPGTHPRLAGIDAPPNSTAAFMATVTGKGDSPAAMDPVAPNQDDLAEDEVIEPHETVVGTTSSSTSEPDESAVVEDAGSPELPPVPSMLSPAPVTVRASDLPVMTGHKSATITDLFAKRAQSDNLDRTWPTFGVVDGSVTANAGSTDASPGTEAGGGDGGDGIDDAAFFAGATPTMGDDSSSGDDTADEATIEPADLDPEAVEASPADGPAPAEGVDDLGTAATTDAPAAVTDFEYSGELEAPVFEWPAPPESTSVEEAVAPIEASAEPAATIDAPMPPEVPSDQPTESPDDDSSDPVDLAPKVNGADRPLPAPFSAPTGATAAEYADAPLAPIIDLRNAAGSSSSDVEEAIKTGEVEVVAALIEQGMLSTDGPISDRDVRTMVYVAFTSNELRKLLVAGGTPDGPNPAIDLGPVELFKDGLVQPPKTLYAGPPVEAEARSQLG